MTTANGTNHDYKGGNYMDKVLFGSPYICLDCDFIFGVVRKNSSIDWKCRKGVNLNPDEKPPCEMEE